MKEMNIIAIFSPDQTKLLMCKRRKAPYKGLLNLIGGKLEPGESSMDAAYRELWEETSITNSDISLTHLMDFIYYLSDIKLEVYYGILQKNVPVHGDENELLWVDADQDFFNMECYAGKGNIGHVIEQIKISAAK